MVIPPKYRLTPKIIQLLQQIEVCKEIINSIAIPPEVEINIRRQSTLKSSLFSAKIEGNPLTMEEVLNSAKQNQGSRAKREIFNILKALNQINQSKVKTLKGLDILKLHKTVMNGLISTLDLGKYRKEAGAIFNSAGQAIYVPPRPSQVPILMNQLIDFINSPIEKFIPIKAVLSHYIFEKIHPFLDGNGRVGRLLIKAVLKKNGYSMKGLLSLEEYLDNQRGKYYKALEKDDRDTTYYIEFMLEIMVNAALTVKEQIIEKQEGKIEDLLLPRRAEILNIIKDHKLINFDQIRRRFLSVNERTLRFDLKKLQDAGLIKKLGNTKGVFYKV